MGQSNWPTEDDKRSLRLIEKKLYRLENELILARNQSNEEILSDFSIEERILLKRLLKDINR